MFYINIMESKLCKCGNERARNHRYCKPCKAKYMREWRPNHTLSVKQRKMMNARSYLHVYVKRGKVNKTPCEVCGKNEVEGHHQDYNKPLEVRWLCKFHHLRLHGKYA